MKGHGAKFPRKKEQAIAALMTCKSVEDAARSCGIGVSTLMRWMKLAEFDREYKKARRTVLLQATSRAQQSSTAAISVLLKLMADPATPPAVRARSAEMVLNLGIRSVEVEDIDDRLAELEQGLPTQQPR
ncbi:MAG: transposase family protein [Acidobacteriota bacterium]